MSVLIYATWPVPVVFPAAAAAAAAAAVLVCTDVIRRSARAIQLTMFAPVVAAAAERLTYFNASCITTNSLI